MEIFFPPQFPNSQKPDYFAIYFLDLIKCDSPNI